MNKQEQQMLLAGGVLLAFWLYQQNRIYQAQLAQISAAAGPVGNLAGTVNAYVPTLVGAIDYWAHN